MIDIDTRSLERAQQLLKGLPGAAEKVTRSAIKRSMRGAKAEAVNEVADRYYAKKSDIKKATTVRVSKMAAELASTGRVTGLQKFRTKPNTPRQQIAYTKRKKYLYANVVKGEGGTIAHAFVARMSSGHVGVFQRRSDGSLRELYGPSIPQAMTRPEVSDRILRGLEQRLAKNVDHEVNAFLMGYRR